METIENLKKLIGKTIKDVTFTDDPHENVVVFHTNKGKFYLELDDFYIMTEDHYNKYYKAEEDDDDDDQGPGIRIGIPNNLFGG